MNVLVKKFISTSLGRFPQKTSVLSWGAVLPPFWKRPIVQKFFALLFKGLENAEEREWVTNLGISSEFQVRLPGRAGPLLLFGRPQDYEAERGALYLARWLAADCSAFLDIGAHRAYFTYFVWNATRGKIPIHYFEPDPTLYAALGRNFSAHPLRDVTGHAWAIGRTSGKSKFFVDLSSDTTASLVAPTDRSQPVKELEVEVLSFSDFVAQQNLNELLVKVDIENAEFDFLEGAAQEFHRIRYLIIEILLPAASQGFIQKVVERFGVHAYYIDNFTLHPTPDGQFDYVPSQYNFLFCHLGPDQLAERLVGTGFKVLPRAKDPTQVSISI